MHTHTHTHTLPLTSVNNNEYHFVYHYVVERAGSQKCKTEKSFNHYRWIDIKLSNLHSQEQAPPYTQD